MDKAPTGDRWVHEVKFDGYRMAARIDHGKVQLLTRSGLDWTAKYPATASELAKLPVTTAYLDGELCGVRADGVTSFELMQQASDGGAGALVYFAFNLIELDGVAIANLSLLKRKERLAAILEQPPLEIAYSEHEGGDGEVFRKAACRHGLEGTRFGGPLALSKVHWVRPELVAEITYLTWSEDAQLRHTVFVGLREDKPAREVRREPPEAASF